jgi:hypothetical protein
MESQESFSKVKKAQQNLVLMLYFTPGETKEWEEQKVSKAS